MPLKRQQDMMATFSMASMTDVIFLLLVFFLVTSTFIFPTALDINLPESAQQTPAKPSTRVFIDPEGNYYVSYGDSDLQPVDSDKLVDFLQIVNAQDPDGSGIAVYADADVAYGKVVEVLNLGAANSLKMVLATRPISNKPSVKSNPVNADGK